MAIDFNSDLDPDLMDDFFKKMSSIDECYNNGYRLITAKVTLADLVVEKLAVMFPFNPKQEESFLKVADLMIEYFETKEEYEKCSELLQAKINITNRVVN